MSRHCEHHDAGPHRAGNNLIWGLTLIGVGSIFLLDRMNIIEVDIGWHFWPLLLALFGLNRIINAGKASHLIKGCFEIFLAFWVYACLERLWGWSFGSSWPVLLIAFGLATIAGGLNKFNRNASEDSGS